jgi:hypothetical protein
MMRGEIKFALGIAGMPSKTITDIEAAIPAAERLLALLPAVEALYAKAKPDLDAVAPVLSEIINFVKGDKL